MGSALRRPSHCLLLFLLFSLSHPAKSLCLNSSKESGRGACALGPGNPRPPPFRESFGFWKRVDIYITINIGYDYAVSEFVYPLPIQVIDECG